MSGRLSTVLVNEHGKKMAVTFAPASGVCTKQSFVKGKWIVSDTLRNSSQDRYRQEIRTSVKWGWTIVRTSEKDLEGYRANERTECLKEVMDRANETGGKDLLVAVIRGFDLLEKKEPRRRFKLYASVRNGRIDDVVRALAAYAQN